MVVITIVEMEAISDNLFGAENEELTVVTFLGNNWTDGVKMLVLLLFVNSQT